ncbi:MAG: ABC transporter permease subunit [Anaerolineales bacterium]|nr:ABC transporter permease subunit [Anaerolineales bacterium]
MNRPAVLKEKFLQVITPRKMRLFRESLTGYLFVTPALILIFTFGIFPVAFAIYVSLHKWRIVRTEFAGLDNYVRAIGNIAYVSVFFLGVGALIGAYMLLKKILLTARELDQKPWPLAIPGLLHTWAGFYFLRYLWYQLPEFLDIADKLRSVEKTRELFMQFINEAFYAPAVYRAWYYFSLVFILAVLAGILALIFYKKPRGAFFQTQFSLAWTALGAGLGLLFFTYQQISRVYLTALDANTDPGIWPQVIVISAGIILLVGGWISWNGASKADRSWKFWLRILGAFTFLVGGWLLIGEIPVIMASGDKDLWEGLKVTLFFSVGTVPMQLTLSMFLAILLFQKLRGSEFFRMVFFLPYVTPFIASAAIFRQIFANRDTSPINLVIRGLGGEGLAWLQESKGVNLILADLFGVSLPAWAAGPSLALMVIMIHSVWTYVGYDIVIYLAGLGNIPKELNDAAAIDGATKWDVFRYITFPLLSPTTYFLSLIAIIGTFKAFAALWVFREGLALGTTNTFSVAIFLEFFEKLRYGYASAMAFILFAIILGLTVINNRFQGSKVFFL